jgi:signal transduction histidine kinase
MTAFRDASQEQARNALLQVNLQDRSLHLIGNSLVPVDGLIGTLQTLNKIEDNSVVQKKLARHMDTLRAMINEADKAMTATKTIISDLKQQVRQKKEAERWLKITTAMKQQQKRIRGQGRIDYSSPTEVDYELRISGSSLNLILDNLVDNALQAMQQLPLRERKIDIELVKQDKTLQLRLCNPGESIPAKLQKRIFEPYFSTKAKGSGLGLALVRQELRKIQAEISLDNNCNNTCFILLFPAHRFRIVTHHEHNHNNQDPS